MEEKIRSELGRIVSGMYYDSQELRIGAMNRIRDVIRKKLEDIDLKKPEEKKADDEKFQNKYTDQELPFMLGMALKKKKITPEEYDYIDQLLKIKDEADRTNEKYKILMQRYIEEEEIYLQFLSHIRGISTVISTKMIKHFGDCSRFPSISALYSYCGYGVVDGHAVKRKKGEKLNFNLKLRSFIWNVADSFVKQRTPVYRDIYDQEKKRQLDFMDRKIPEAPQSLKHADLRARRKMVKIFLSNYWTAARELSGQETKSPYSEGILRHTHIIKWQDVVAKNDAAKEQKELTGKKVKKDKIKA